MAPVRILFDLVTSESSDGNLDVARLYLARLAESLEASDAAEVCVVGDPRGHSSTMMGGLKKRLHSWEMRRTIAEFKPDIVHRVGSFPSEDLDTSIRRYCTPGNMSRLDASRPMTARDGFNFVCATECTRRRLTEQFAGPASAMAVVPPGVNLPVADEMRRTTRGNYFLYFGPRGKEWRFVELLESLATTPTLENIRIVAIGENAFTHSERNTIRALGLADRVITDSAGPESYPGYFSGALAFIQSAPCDEFGLQVLEAMAHGCPVACARTDCLIEIAAEAALYFDPADSADFGTTLVHLAADSNLRERLSLAGRARTAGRTWQSSAAKLLAAYLADGVDELVNRPADPVGT